MMEFYRINALNKPRLNFDIIILLGLFDTDNLDQEIKKKTGLKRSASLKEGWNSMIRDAKGFRPLGKVRNPFASLNINHT